MTYPLPLPAGMSAETFLAEHWQKKPLLVRSAFPGFESPLTPAEVAGMACEEGIESRLIQATGGATPWQLSHGPFSHEVFRALPASHWTVLVQEVHRYVPELALLLESFRFIPSWRVDDIMVSYAPIDGSVGPHVDQYDVFLLQGLGRKRWEIAAAEVGDADLIPHADLRILARFEAQQCYELAAGDMLYLPPGISHHGIALEDNLTYSIGFRAPTERDLAISFVEYLAAGRLSDTHYRDPDLEVQQHPGEISGAALRRARAMIERIPVTDDDIARWFGCFLTESKHGDEVEPPADRLTPAALLARFRQGETLWRSEASRFACIQQSSAILLFVAGELVELNLGMADAVYRLCDQRVHSAVQWGEMLAHRATCELLCRLYNDGHLYFDHDAG